jgi:predicted nucleic acid-binding protein
MRMPWEDVIGALDAIRVLFPYPLAITIATHEAAQEVAQKYGLGIYDSLIVAAAIEAHCSALYSEDLQDGQIINGKLTIRNPFR